MQLFLFVLYPSPCLLSTPLLNATSSHPCHHQISCWLELNPHCRCHFWHHYQCNHCRYHFCPATLSSIALLELYGVRRYMYVSSHCPPCQPLPPAFSDNVGGLITAGIWRRKPLHAAIQARGQDWGHNNGIEMNCTWSAMLSYGWW